LAGVFAYFNSMHFIFPKCLGSQPGIFGFN
jgi:hypothetical protein